MKKLFILGVLLGLFGTSNVFASEVENVNVPVAVTNEISENLAKYWATNVYYDANSAGGPYVRFTINWKYTGTHNADIAFIVYVYNSSNVLVTEFQDSAYGIAEGSRDYKIKVDREDIYHVKVNGWEGDFTK